MFLKWTFPRYVMNICILSIYQFSNMVECISVNCQGLGDYKKEKTYFNTYRILRLIFIVYKRLFYILIIIVYLPFMYSMKYHMCSIAICILRTV